MKASHLDYNYNNNMREGGAEDIGEAIEWTNTATLSVEAIIRLRFVRSLVSTTFLRWPDALFSIPHCCQSE